MYKTIKLSDKLYRIFLQIDFKEISSISKSLDWFYNTIYIRIKLAFKMLTWLECKEENYISRINEW